MEIRLNSAKRVASPSHTYRVHVMYMYDVYIHECMYVHSYTSILLYYTYTEYTHTFSCMCTHMYVYMSRGPHQDQARIGDLAGSRTSKRTCMYKLWYRYRYMNVQVQVHECTCTYMYVHVCTTCMYMYVLHVCTCMYYMYVQNMHTC